MKNEKTTLLYMRLSHDDELQGESMSIIQYQKQMFEEYFQQNTHLTGPFYR